MIRLLSHLAINLATAALGLLIASWLNLGLTLHLNGFLAAVVIFAASTAVFTPFLFNIARKHATAMLGGVGLFATLLALWLATLVPGGIEISGLQGWLGSTVVVWLVTAIGGGILLWYFLGRKAAARRS